MAGTRAEALDAVSAFKADFVDGKLIERLAGLHDSPRLQCGFCSSEPGFASGLLPEVVPNGVELEEVMVLRLSLAFRQFRQA